MDQRQQQHINEAAEKFAAAIKESYEAVADRSVSAQELNAQLTQDFLNLVLDDLKSQAESNRALAEDLIEQRRRQQEASQGLAQQPANAYMDILSSMFAYYRENLRSNAGGGDTEERTDHQGDQISEQTVWKGTGQGIREGYLALLERTGEIKPGSSKLPADFWDLPRPDDPEGLVRRAVQEDRR
jgi:hypothetical protein